MAVGAAVVGTVVVGMEVVGMEVVGMAVMVSTAASMAVAAAGERGALK